MKLNLAKIGWQKWNMLYLVDNDCDNDNDGDGDDNNDDESNQMTLCLI